MSGGSFSHALAIDDTQNRLIATSIYDNNHAGSAYIYDLSFDTTPPGIIPMISGTLGAKMVGTPAILSWVIVDEESSFTTVGCDSVVAITDTTGQSFRCEASSEGGTHSETVTLKRGCFQPNLVATPE
ncbi:MAG: hypothetical protein R2865_05750 [Deinococcales bacterium]